MSKLGRMSLLKSWSISPSATAFSSACVGDHSNGFVNYFFVVFAPVFRDVSEPLPGPQMVYLLDLHPRESRCQ